MSQLSLEGGHSLEREESQWGYRFSALPTPAPPPSCSGHSGKISPASGALEGGLSSFGPSSHVAGSDVTRTVLWFLEIKKKIILVLNHVPLQLVSNQHVDMELTVILHCTVLSSQMGDTSVFQAFRS